jgi:outer membrane protein OmpA-like peptidoglycan-associated protein
MSRRLDDQEPPERNERRRGSIPVENRARHRSSLSALLAVTFALVGGAACGATGTDDAPAPNDAVPSASPAQPDGAMDADLAYDPLVLTITAIDIDTRLAVLCGLDESKVFFKFDSTKLLPSAKERLEQIATCSKTGPIKDQALLMVGRADPVGSDEYNQALGMSRADAVANYLSELGVDKALIVTESRGEAAAEEKFPGNWPYNRRVTLRLQSSPGNE